MSQTPVDCNLLPKNETSTLREKAEVSTRWSLLTKLFRDRYFTTPLVDPKYSENFCGLFESYHLIKSETISEKEGDEFSWKTHSTFVNNALVSVAVRHLTGPIVFEELLKFNNTGNVCIWPAEEVLAYYLLTQKSRFKNKSVLELGGGMTCLAGLMLAAACKCAKILLTDGSEDAIANLQHSIERNEKKFITTEVDSRVVRWDNFNEKHTDLIEGFDFVICADCLFFDEFRNDLASTIGNVLKPGGEAILIAPKRGHSFDDFVSICKSDSFKSIFSSVTVESRFDDHVYKLCEHFLKHSTNFSPNRHQPILITLRKSNQSSNT